MARKLIVYIASSIDGYIAAPGDDLSFLNAVQVEGEDYGYHAFIDTVDTVIMGRRTYDWVLQQGVVPHADKQLYVITSKPQTATGNLHYYSGELTELIRNLKSQPGKDLFCDGGSKIIHQLLQAQEVDQLIISVVPVLLGGGTRLFTKDYPMQKGKLVKTQSYDTGLVQLHYELIRENHPNI